MNKRDFFTIIVVGFLLGWNTATFLNNKRTTTQLATIEESTAMLRRGSEAISIQSNAITNLNHALEKCLNVVRMQEKAIGAL